ncbi:MAG TPA: rod shape-determining protein MreD [Terriglobales bacterium]|nr:rod shape-determining protein MreD [Terriglobales bacterium]
MRAAVPQIFSTSRAEATVFRFPPLFFPLLCALALIVQAYLPVLLHAAVYLDLPLLAVVYWATTNRHAGPSSLMGAVLGLAQDSLSHLALGINGIAKTLIGYVVASLGARMDADHPGIRLLLVFACYEFNRSLIYFFERFLLGTPLLWRGSTMVGAALANGLVAVLLFQGLDRFRRWM